jgi:hypothetical protein
MMRARQTILLLICLATFAGDVGAAWADIVPSPARVVPFANDQRMIHRLEVKYLDLLQRSAKLESDYRAYRGRCRDRDTSRQCALESALLGAELDEYRETLKKYEKQRHLAILFKQYWMGWKGMISSGQAFKGYAETMRLNNLRSYYVIAAIVAAGLKVYDYIESGDFPSTEFPSAALWR